MSKKRAESPVEALETENMDTPSQATFIEPVALPSSHYATVDLDFFPPDESLDSEGPDRDMVRSVLNYGVLHPVTMIGGSDFPFLGHAELVAGRKRVMAARAARLLYERLSQEEKLNVAKPSNFIPVQVYHIGELNGGDPRIASWSDYVQLIENEQRKRNPLSNLLAIERLIHRGIGEKEICKQAGMPVATYRRTVKLLKLVPELLSMFKGKRISTNVAEAAAGLSRDLQYKLVHRYNLNRTLTLKDIKEVKQVAKEEGVAGLQDCLFETDSPDLSAGGWQGLVIQQLQSAYNIAAGRDQSLADMIGTIIQEYGEGESLA